ncbi:unnamed protein product [Miscanthus lutarioriparius]|uniref:Uncharacterized protein n=1 Tax=Miscanthus lutarioriparius TaxID=422564 RepID=A0A811QT17_9POAL|nr:unnamed protein product [Miscanthus lutarioriparius]
MRSSSSSGWQCRSALLPSLHGSTGGWHRGSDGMEPPRRGSGGEVSSSGGSGGLDPGGGGSVDLTVRSPLAAGSTVSNAAAALPLPFFSRSDPALPLPDSAGIWRQVAWCGGGGQRWGVVVVAGGCGGGGGGGRRL